MQKAVIAIADAEEEYLKALSCFFMEYGLAEYKILTFSSRQSLEMFVSFQHSPVNVFILAGEFYEFRTRLESMGAVCILLDDGRTGITEDILRIRKYKRADEIIKDIIAKCASEDAHSENTDIRRETCFFSVVSPSGGVGKTVIALGICLYLTYIGKKVLYINLENMPSTPAFFRVSEENSITHLLMGIKGNAADLAERVKKYSLQDRQSGVSYFSPAVNNLDMEELGPEGMGHLLKSIKKSGAFDFAVADMQSGFTFGNMAAMSFCDYTFCVVVQDDMNKVRIPSWLDSIKKAESRYNFHIIDKMKFVINKYGHFDPDNRFVLPEICGAYEVIPFVPGGLDPKEMAVDRDFSGNGMLSGIKRICKPVTDEVPGRF